MPRIVKPTDQPPRLEEYAQLPITNDADYIRGHLLKLARDLKNQPEPDCRFRKIQSAYRQCIGYSHVGYPNSYKFVPEINLVGLWLHDAGFIMGNYTRIYALDKVIVLCEDARYIKSAPMLNLYQQ